MTEYIHLIGAENVRSAGNSMVSAVRDMQRAASSIEYSLSRHQRFFDDWLMRFQEMLEERIKETGD